jgi:hypothetical protein
MDIIMIMGIPENLRQLMIILVATTTAIITIILTTVMVTIGIIIMEVRGIPTVIMDTRGLVMVMSMGRSIPTLNRKIIMPEFGRFPKSNRASIDPRVGIAHLLDCRRFWHS